MAMQLGCKSSIGGEGVSNPPGGSARTHPRPYIFFAKRDPRTAAMYPASAGNMVARASVRVLAWLAYMDTYINRKQVLQQYGFDVRKEQWAAEDVQERPKGVGKEKWYRREAVAAKAVAKLESVPVERVVVQEPEVEAKVEVPALQSAEHSALQSAEPCSGLHKSESVESVVVAKKAMNFRFVIGTRGEVVRVQDNKRVKIGMRLAVRSVSPGHYASLEVVR